MRTCGKQVRHITYVYVDEARFMPRVEACKRLRQEAFDILRNTKFIDSQPSSMFAPIQQSALYRIVGKLISNSDPEALVMARQTTVEKLLNEVRP